MPFTKSRSSSARSVEKPRRYLIEGLYLTQGQAQQDAQLYPYQQFGFPRSETAQTVLDFLNQQAQKLKTNRLYQQVRIVDQRTHVVLSSTPEVSPDPA